MIYIGHPGDVHFFKNFIKDMENKNNEIKVCAVDKELVFYLLNAYNIDFTIIGKNNKGLIKKSIGMLKKDYRMYKVAKQFDPYIILGFGNVYGSHVAKLLNKKSIWFADTEHSSFVKNLTLPFVDRVITPECYLHNLGYKHLKYKGYKELAYLHPKHFEPDLDIFDKMNLKSSDKFYILRFISWSASHDIGQRGLNYGQKKKLIKKLSKEGKVLITSESKLPQDLKKYKINIPPEKIHDLMYFSNMVITEGGTMATESAILGTPTIFINPLVGTMGNFIELEEKYNLLYSFRNFKPAFGKMNYLLNMNDIKEKWQEKREKLLKEKIDVTSWMINFVEKFND